MSKLEKFLSATTVILLTTVLFFGFRGPLIIQRVKKEVKEIEVPMRSAYVIGMPVKDFNSKYGTPKGVHYEDDDSLEKTLVYTYENHKKLNRFYFSRQNGVFLLASWQLGVDE